LIACVLNNPPKTLCQAHTHFPVAWRNYKETRGHR